SALVLSQLSERPKKDFIELRPMANYAARALGQDGVSEGRVKLFKNFDDLCQAIKQGEVNWVTETALMAARLHSECDAIPIAIKWKKNQSQYSSVIYTRKDSGLNSLADLKGKVMALESEFSFSAFYLSRQAFADQGIQLQKLARPNSPVDTDKVGYIFSRNEKNNVLLVLKSIAAAGAVNDGDWKDPKILSASDREQLLIIHQSSAYPRSFELVSAKLAKPIQQALQQLLLSMDPDQQGNILSRYERAKGFAAISQAEIDTLKAIAHNYRGWQ
ncbi:MAG: phosphate/phosphite/phosphonate ABC transporter substrate-binding protein, partial [Cellvibrionaceae bacterium]|nr:phosphate/phosphite/phosphonate ABC transporter substrate-binding protein [Cellvibrionaceae bacterium]